MNTLVLFVSTLLVCLHTHKSLLLAQEPSVKTVQEAAVAQGDASPSTKSEPGGWLSFTPDSGLSSESPLLKPPGKADFLYRRREDANDWNFIWWSPIFKGGAGIVDPDGQGTTNYFGGFVRPLAPWPDKGDLILGVNGFDAEEDDAWEFQGEYRFPFGLGFGGGMVGRNSDTNEAGFGKLTFRSALLGWNYILETQAQDVDGEVSPGGYGAVYNDYLMGVGGTDGEQWRGTFGLIFPELNEYLHPAGEILYVDNTIGDIDGPKFLFVNATLDFSGGFLSHPARLGRAMGPQGLEYGNPLGFLRPTWNRRLDVWELGGLTNFRLVRVELPNGAVNEKYEALLYPFHLDERKNLLDGFFLGATFINTRDDDTPGVLAGYSGKLGFLKVSCGFEYDTRTDDMTATVGIIDAF